MDITKLPEPYNPETDDYVEWLEYAAKWAAHVKEPFLAADLRGAKGYPASEGGPLLCRYGKVNTLEWLEATVGIVKELEGGVPETKSGIRIANIAWHWDVTSLQSIVDPYLYFLIQKVAWEMNSSEGQRADRGPTLKELIARNPEGWEQFVAERFEEARTNCRQIDFEYVKHHYFGYTE